MSDMLQLVVEIHKHSSNGTIGGAHLSVLNLYDKLKHIGH